MFINPAHAQDVTLDTSVGTEAIAPIPNAPSATEAFMYNMGLVLVLVVLFYVLLIMPQQRRFKEHKAMLDKLENGDKVITGGGLVGKIDKVLDDDEIVIDLGNGVKVTALRSTIQTKAGDIKKAANDTKAAEDKAKAKK